MMKPRSFAAIAALALLAGPAAAHVEAGQVQGFFSGLAHPVSGLDHVLAMVAVGLWGAQLGVPALWLLGALVTLDRPLPSWTLTAIAAALGLLLGAANGQAMAQAGAGARGILGSVAALFVASTLVAAAAVAWQGGWLRLAWRVAGSWLAASGLLLLGWSVRGG